MFLFICNSKAEIRFRDLAVVSHLLFCSNCYFFYTCQVQMRLYCEYVMYCYSWIRFRDLALVTHNHDLSRDTVYIDTTSRCMILSSDQFCKHLKTSLFVSEDTDPSWERLWFKWRYINVWLRFKDSKESKLFIYTHHHRLGIWNWCQRWLNIINETFTSRFSKVSDNSRIGVLFGA